MDKVIKERGKTQVIGSEVLPKVATNFYYSCKKCETDRYHKVLAHPTPSSAQLECEVCKRKSTFRLSKKSSRKNSSATRQVKNQSLLYETWVQLKNQVGVDLISPYRMTDSFSVQSAIEHPQFGVGFVTSVQGQKIEVAFKEGPKNLIHNRSS